MDKLKLLKGGAPFYYSGNETGCLVLHGFTGAPNEVRWLGQHLNQQGYTVYGPRLAGHGTTLEDLAYVTWHEWYYDVLAGYEMLRRQCDRVFVLGLSMGGALTMTLAAREAVDGIVVMSAPHQIDDWRKPLIPLLSIFVPTLPKDAPPPDEDPFYQRVLEEQIARGEEPIGHPSYHGWSLRGVKQVLALLKVMRNGLPEISAPALLVHSKNDDVVSIENLQLNYNAVGSANKEMLILENSLHVITEDVERETVFKAAADFVAKHS